MNNVLNYISLLVSTVTYLALLTNFPQVDLAITFHGACGPTWVSTTTTINGWYFFSFSKNSCVLSHPLATYNSTTLTTETKFTNMTDERKVAS